MSAPELAYSVVGIAYVIEYAPYLAIHIDTPNLSLSRSATEKQRC